MKCPSCGVDNSLTANFCQNCGFALVDNAGTQVSSSEEKPCRQCGVAVPLGAQFCGNCGATEPHNPQAGADAQPAKSKPTKPVVPPPPKTAGSPVAVPEGWPDVTEELAEVRFHLLTGDDEDAKKALDVLQKRFPGHPDLQTDLVLDRSVIRKAPEDPDKEEKPAEDPAESAPTMVPASKRTAPTSVPEDVSATVVKAPAPEPDAEPKADDPREAAGEGFPAEIVAKSEGWGDAPAPGGTVISRAPSADQPNVLPVGTESSQVQLTEAGEPSAAGASPRRVRNEVSATVVRSTPEGPSATEEAAVPAGSTVVSDRLQPPKPYKKREKSSEWLEGGGAAELVVARPGRPRGPKTTMVSNDPERPAPPAPFGGEAPPGSTMIPGTTPPKGGFPPLAQAPPGVDFEQRPPLAARRGNVPVSDGDPEELTTAEMKVPEVPDTDAPLTPLPHVPATAEVLDQAAEPKTNEFPPESTAETVAQAPAQPEQVRAMTAPLRTDDPPASDRPLTSEGTVITANPLPPAPYEGRPPSPMQPVRLVMLGSRGQPVAERTLAPGDVLEVGRDLSEPWGDDEYLSDRHALIRPAPGGGVMADDLEGKGPVYRQIEHRRQIRSGDQFRVGQSLVTFVGDEGGSRLEVLVNSEGEPHIHPLGPGGLILGREEGDIMFPDDTYVSSSHCRFSEESGTAFVEDLGSSNGTYVRVRPDDVVEFGALLLLGHTQFRIQAVPDA